MLSTVEPRHVAEFLSPFERGTTLASDFEAMQFQAGVLPLGSGEPILVPSDALPDFEVTRQRLLDEAV